MIKVGNRHAAKGMMIELFTLAQEYWFPLRLGIPMDRIQQAGLEPCIDSGLANITADGVFAQGSEKAFAWLFEKQRAGNASADSRKKKKAAKKTNTSQQPSTGVDVRQQTPTSSSFSSSSSFSNSDSNSSSSNIAPSDFSNRVAAVSPSFSDLSQTFWEREVTEEVLISWMTAFPDSEWIVEEIKKALGWEIANPARKKKNFVRFIFNWLTRGWDQRKHPALRQGPNPAEKREAANRQAELEYLKKLDEVKNEQAS